MKNLTLSALALALTIGLAFSIDAAADKHNAGYVEAKEKCDVLAGSVKDLCMSEAKIRFGK